MTTLIITNHNSEDNIEIDVELNFSPQVGDVFKLTPEIFEKLKVYDRAYRNHLQSNVGKITGRVIGKGELEAYDVGLPHGYLVEIFHSFKLFKDRVKVIKRKHVGDGCLENLKEKFITERNNKMQEKTQNPNLSELLDKGHLLSLEIIDTEIIQISLMRLIERVTLDFIL